MTRLDEIRARTEKAQRDVRNEGFASLKGKVLREDVPWLLDRLQAVLDLCDRAFIDGDDGFVDDPYDAGLPLFVEALRALIEGTD